jgi:hypothetical protein
MRFKIHKENGALNSPPIFAALEQGIKNNGFSVVDHDQDVDVIWSVLWHGRMQQNKIIYDRCRQQNRPVMIIEVGNLSRGTSWRVSLDHIHQLGKFGNSDNLDKDRSKKLNVNLKPFQQFRNNKILIACQHEKSLQWDGMPSMAEWVRLEVEKIRKFTDRPIVVRPHPRSPFQLSVSNVSIELPRKLPNTYDGFNIDYRYHCVINYNSGPAVQAAISGTPVVCDQSSLAFPVSDQIENIDGIALKDREDWFLKLCHTEWTVPEIAEGTPIRRLIPDLENYIKNH